VQPHLPLTLWIEESILVELAGEADDHVPNETGGVLLGYRTGDEVVVRSAIGAGPAATRWSTGFRPDNEFQEGEIERLFRSSAGVLTYLGDWHSHPATGPEPSRRDRKTLRRIASDPEAECPTPVMVILERKDIDAWTAGCWVAGLGRFGRWGPLTVRPLRMRTFGALGIESG
jgi:integrative and conjugative element protein (TIGR02256 family)